MRRLVTIVLMAAALVLIAPSNAMQNPQQLPAQAVIYNQAPVSFSLVRTGTEKQPEYQFVGVLALCDKVLDVRVLTVYSAFDSTQVAAALYNRTLEIADTCVIETFVFRIHGGILRKQLEKPGTANVIIHGATLALRFELTAEGEQQLLDIILKAEESPI